MNRQGIVWIKLDEDSKRLLLESVGQKFETLYNDHVTLAFKVLESDFAEYVGKKVSFVATDSCSGKDIQAIKVSLPEWVVCTNGVPHITVSAAKGTPPNKSNEMLAGDSFEAMSLGDGLELSGVIEFFEFKQK